MEDIIKKRLKKAKKEGKLLIGDYVIEGSLTVICKQDKECITLIPENDYTYPHIRWLHSTGRFMVSLVAHTKKIIAGVEYEDNHFSIYTGNESGDSKTGVLDLEFWQKDPQLSIEGQNMVMKKQSNIVLQSPSGKYFSLKISDSGAISAEPISIHTDSERL